jgi:hypothetical protein
VEGDEEQVEQLFSRRPVVGICVGEFGEGPQVGCSMAFEKIIAMSLGDGVFELRKLSMAHCLAVSPEKISEYSYLGLNVLRFWLAVDHLDVWLACIHTLGISRQFLNTVVAVD